MVRDLWVSVRCPTYHMFSNSLLYSYSFCIYSVHTLRNQKLYNYNINAPGKAESLDRLVNSNGHQRSSHLAGSIIYKSNRVEVNRKSIRFSCYRVKSKRTKIYRVPDTIFKKVSGWFL